MVPVCWVPGYAARVPEQTIHTTAYGLIFFARNRLPVPFGSQRETRVKPESRRSRTADAVHFEEPSASSTIVTISPNA
jgi:hypothetical protein